MKVLIITFPLILLFCIFTLFQQNVNIHQYYLYKLKYITEEMTAAGAQYIEKNDYINGNIVFNREEGMLAGENILKESLRLDDNFSPKANSYFNQKIEYRLEFFDDKNTNFPIIYNDEDSGFTTVVKEPSVVGSINAGFPKYRVKFAENSRELIRTSVFEWKGY